MSYTKRQIDYFKDQLKYHSNDIILKSKLVDFALSNNLEIKKNIAKNKLIEMILENEVLIEKLMNICADKILIPYYIVATTYCLTYYQVSELDHLGIIKSCGTSDKGATLYPFSILALAEDYLINEYEKMYKTDFHRTRIEFKSNEEEHVNNFIDKLSNVFDIENMSKLYKKRDNEGYHLYLSIRPKTKALNNDNILATQNANLKTNLSIQLSKVADLERELNDIKQDIYKAPQYIELRKKFNELNIKVHKLHRIEYNLEYSKSNYKSLEIKYNELQNKYNELSSSINKKNAGRPNKLSDSDIELMKMYRLQGQNYRTIATLFNCSVGLVSKVLKDFKPVPNK